MSPPRKPKTLDTDEGARRPSEKVAIDEVLRSLQDLVQNELSIDAPPPATAARGKAKKEEAPPPPPQPETDFPEGFPSLEGMEEEDITLEALPEPEPEPEPVLELELAPEPEPKKPATRSKSVKLPSGQQQELPHLDLPSSGRAVSKPSGHKPLEIVEDSPLSLDTAESQENEIVAAPAPADEPDSFSVAFEATSLPETTESDPFSISFESSSPAPTPPGATDNTDHGDIPVLDDAVDLTDEFHIPPPASSPAAPIDAHRLAVQVAARLNVELRREGKPVLSSEIMTRLTHVLEEALAKGAANMENSPSEKH